MNRILIALGLSLMLTGAMAVQTLAEDAPTNERESQTERDQRTTPPALTEAEAIAQVKAANLMQGDKTGSFHAERALSRAELATILVKTFKLNSREAVNPTTEALKDVPPSYWAAADINTVVRLGIMKGYRDGLFYPEQRIDRAEALAIFAQAYGVQQYDDETVRTILAPYPDAKEIPGWAEKAMATSLKYGFLDVPPNGKIRPMQPMTRGDMAFALGQYLNRLHPTEHPVHQ